MNTKEIKTEFNNFLKTEEGRSWQKRKPIRICPGISEITFTIFTRNILHNL